MNQLEKNLKENSKISDEFKELARDVFGKLFYMLGKEGFIKWLQFQNIEYSLRYLAIEWAEEEEMKDALGSYNPLKNTIKLSRKLKEKGVLLKVAKHETLHFFTRENYFSSVCPYLSEGCTEYLNHLTSINDDYEYEENVDMVAFLRSLMGNSIIETYLTRNKNPFLKDLDKLLGEVINNPIERKKEISDFFSNLKKRLYIDMSYLDKETSDKVFPDKQEYNSYNNLDLIMNFMRTLIVGKAKQMVRAGNFSPNGRFDEQFVKQFLVEQLNNISSIFSYQTEIDIEGCCYNIISKLKENPKSEIRAIPNLLNFGLRSEEEFLSKKNSIPICKYSDYLVMIDSTLGQVSEEICEKYDPEGCYQIILDNKTRNLAVFNVLSKRNSIEEAKFRKIGDSEYVEQRDGKFIYLKFNDDGTVIEEDDLSKVKHIFKIKDTLDSIRVVNGEDDYKGLGILNEEQFQLVEMVSQITQEIVYQKDVNIEDEVSDMNLIIQDSQLLDKVVKTSLKKRTRLQVFEWINVLTKAEMKDAIDQIYDEALIESGLEDIVRKEEFNQLHNALDYEVDDDDDEYDDDEYDDEVEH